MRLKSCASSSCSFTPRSRARRRSNVVRLIDDCIITFGAHSAPFYEGRCQASVFLFCFFSDLYSILAQLDVSFSGNFARNYLLSVPVIVTVHPYTAFAKERQSNQFKKPSIYKNGAFRPRVRAKTPPTGIQINVLFYAFFNNAPSGTMSFSRYCHNAISSFLATATIPIRLILLPPPPNRS